MMKGKQREDRALAKLKASGAEGASHLQLGTAAVGVESNRVISANDRTHIGRALGLRLVKTRQGHSQEQAILHRARPQDRRATRGPKRRRPRE
jgi:hypothetical protein